MINSQQITKDLKKIRPRLLSDSKTITPIGERNGKCIKEISYIFVVNTV